MNKEITCIICPRSCTICKNTETGEINGFTCVRGKNYATQEFNHPQRTICSFVTCKNGDIVCVKTDKPIDKELIFKLKDLLASTHPDKIFKIGDVVIENVLNTDVNVVCTRGNRQ